MSEYEAMQAAFRKLGLGGADVFHGFRLGWDAASRHIQTPPQQPNPNDVTIGLTGAGIGGQQAVMQ